MNGATVSFVDRYAQPSATSKEVNPTKRPSIVVGGDNSSLAAVQTVLSPRSAGGKMVIASPTASGMRVRGAWRAKLLGAGWTGPADIALSAILFVASTRCYGHFLRWYASRTDVAFATLDDPVLSLRFVSIDCSLYTFAIVNAAVLAMLKYAIKKPDVLLEAVQTTALMLWMRMATLLLMPLASPGDGTAQFRGSVFVTSIPTATVAGLLLCVRRHDHAWRMGFALVVIATAAMQVLQKTQFTIEVLAAPCVAHTTHTLVTALRQSVGSVLSTTTMNKREKSMHGWTSTKPKAKQL